MSNLPVPARRAALLAVCLAGAVAGLAPWGSPGWFAGAAVPLDPAQMPDTLAFDIHYGGTGAEGVDMLWRAEAGGAVPGHVALRMAYAGDPLDRAMPIWPVSAWLFYSADDPRGSFVAELSGTINWRTGEMRAGGLVSDGARDDTGLEYRMRVARPGLKGSATIVFYPRQGGGVSLRSR